MFYVVGNKMYLAEHDGKVYPEVTLEVDSEGYFFFKKTGGGLPKKPAKRQMLSKAEIIAKFGSKVLEPEEDNPPELNKPAK